MLSYWRIVAAICCLVAAIPVGAQSTQGLISGRATNPRTGTPIANATIVCSADGSTITNTARSDDEGYYYFPLLSPGHYKIRATAPDFQPQEMQNVDLPVAGRIQLDFQLRPLSDVFSQGQYRGLSLPGSEAIVPFFGPDVDTSRSVAVSTQRITSGPLDSSISEVVDSNQIMNLPLEGRDVYTMLVTQPGVTSDTTTSRSLGLSAVGQRPSASNFLFDGLQNNNYLVTGPQISVAPEVVQEYRVSTSNYSAEYGGTAGYIANAITRTGGTQWHGITYFHLFNEALNANDFQDNLAGEKRLKDREDQFGYYAGGPLNRSKSLTLSSSFQYTRDRNEAAPQTYTLPSSYMLSIAPAGSIARQLLNEFPAPTAANGTNLTVNLDLRAPVTVNQTQLLERLDYALPDGKNRLMSRFAWANVDRPDYQWSPYKGLSSALTDRTYDFALVLQTQYRPTLTNELRFGGIGDSIYLNRVHSEVPGLLSLDGTTLPSSPLFANLLSHKSNSWEWVDNLMHISGRHLVRVGGGVLFRPISGSLGVGQDGQYTFSDASTFLTDSPLYFRASLDRQALQNGTLQIPNAYRQYRSTNFYLFMQDSFRVTSHLVLNYGLRYDAFGAPTNVGAIKDPVVEMAAGVQPSLTFPGGGNQALYNASRMNFEPRFGFAYDPFGKGQTVVRGGFGIFSDTNFDNLWLNLQNNGFVLPSAYVAKNGASYLTPVASVLPAYANAAFLTSFPPVTKFQQNLPAAYNQSMFLGIQHKFTNNFSITVNGMADLARKLVTTDLLNRANGYYSSTRGTDYGFVLYPNLGVISYTGSQGDSDYTGLSTVARYQTNRIEFQATYTWSHSIDNQSDPLLNNYFDLSSTRLSGPNSEPGISAFSIEGNPRVDRANSDFDQRQNLVILSVFSIPAWKRTHWVDRVTRDWKLSEIAAFRSGMPYTVFASTSIYSPVSYPVINNRADLINPSTAQIRQAAAGGFYVLNASDFTNPPEGGVLGNTGRNAFVSPGFYNLDVSLSRSFPLRRLGEAGTITFRADAFNFLNHANLNGPQADMSQPDFGLASYGRPAASTQLPGLSPLGDTARQVQLMLRISF
jgi:hypothetical protein